MNKELTEAKERIKTILRFRNQVEGDIPLEEGGTKIMSTKEIRLRIEIAAGKLGLDANKLMCEYGVTTALAEMLESEITKKT